MALFGIVSSPRLEGAEVACGSVNLLTKLKRPSPDRFVGKHSTSTWTHRPSWGVRCSFSKRVSTAESEENSPSTLSVTLEEDSGHVVRFKMSDFKILDRVSTGLGGRVRRT